MKINLAVLFGGRSVEHEVSVISAVQAMASMNKEKYNIIPVYMTKKSEFYTGEKLMDINLELNTNIKKDCLTKWIECFTT